MEIDLDDNDRFIAECAEEARRAKRTKTQDGEDRPQCATEADNPKSKADEIICNAEAVKIRMLGTPGKCNYYTENMEEGRFNRGSALQHSSIVDENYVAIGSHIDVGLQEKIKRGSMWTLQNYCSKISLLLPWMIKNSSW